MPSGIGLVTQSHDSCYPILFLDITIASRLGLCIRPDIIQSINSDKRRRLKKKMLVPG